MKCLFNYLLLVGVAVGLGCQNKLLSKAEPELFFGTNDNIVPNQYFESCNIRYSLINSTSTLDQSSQELALQTVVNIWGQAHGHLEFEAVDATQEADIRVAFTDTIKFVQREGVKGLIGQQVIGLSHLKRNTDGKTCTIFLRKSYDWKLPILQRILLYQIGAALGLPDSEDKNSAMSLLRTSTATLALSGTDSAAISESYNQLCNHLTPLPNPEYKNISGSAEGGFTIGGKLYILYSEGYSPSITKIGLWEYNPSKSAWVSRKEFPLTKNKLIIFTIGNRAFVGDPITKKLQEYIPANASVSDEWKAITDLPDSFSNDTRPIAFSINGKAYVIGQDKNRQSIIWSYKLSENKWEPLSGNFLLSSAINSALYSKMFIVANVAYFMKPQQGNMLPTSWAFDPSNSSVWIPVSGYPSSESSWQSFSIRKGGYIITLQNYELWRFEPSKGWKFMGNLPRNNSLYTFGFELNNRAYIGALINNLLYLYNP